MKNITFKVVRVRILHLMIALLGAFPVLSQGPTRINLPLKNFIAAHERDGSDMQLLVKGNMTLIKEQLSLWGGNLRPVFRDYGIATLPIDKVEALAACDCIERIDYGPAHRGYLLNDTMLVRNRVTGVQEGQLPLQQGYSGKGTLIGFIDTGIDFTHPDFRDSLGNTRVLHIWDQTQDTLVSSRIPQPYGYGQVWDSTDINSGACTHDDAIQSHGTNVAGIAAGNGLAVGRYKGVAPEADMVVVASDFNSSNWLSTVADAVAYIFGIADSLDRPCVVNISAGSYLGSHDGSDPAALRIDSMVKAKSGRFISCAAGNLGNRPFHLKYQVTSDTNFTWFTYNPSINGVFLELWADTADFSQVEFAFGADKRSPSFSFRGRTAFDHIGNRLNMIYRDSVMSGSKRLSYVDTYAEVVDDKYLFQAYFPAPDSNQYYFRFITTGNGTFDVWGDQVLGVSSMVSQGLPSAAVFPDIVYYKAPDTLSTVVSSFSCLPSVITVANYINRDRYVDVDTVLQIDTSLVGYDMIPGEIAATSCSGPTRTGLLKPDVAATGDLTITAHRLASIALDIANNQSNRIGLGGMHKRNGGTSMASPVVAGIAALYFERCPTATYQQLIDVITGTAYSDAFASPLPDFKWGNGKVDAFAVLTANHSRPAISPALFNEICEGESIELKASPGYVNYQWSNGGGAPSVEIDTTTSLWLQTVDTNGCISRSDSVFVTVNEVPLKPDIARQDSLLFTTAVAEAYQWYLDGDPIPAATDSLWVAKKNGSYQVEVVNTYDCSAFSDTIVMDISAGIDAHQAADPAPTVYPNPVSGRKYYVAFASLLTTFPVFEMTDITGRRLSISVVKTNNNTFEVSVDQELKGVFLLRIHEGETWIRRRIVFQ